MSRYRSTTPTLGMRSDRMWRRNQNTTRFVPSVALGPVTHTILVALMIAVLGLIYLTQVTKTSTYGYQLDSLETKRSELLAERQDLENENARLQARERVQNSSVASAMQRPSSTEYATN